MKITVERFKNIAEVHLEVLPLTMLIGGNNSGKSSILQAIQFAVSAAQTTSTQNSYWVEGRLSTSISPTDLIYSPLKDVYALAPNGRLRENPDEAIKITLASDADECVVSVKKGRNKNIVIELVGETLGKQLQSLVDPFSIIVPGLAGIPYSEEYETPLIVRKAAARGDSNRVFRNILWLLKKDQARWDEFTSRLQTLFPDVELAVEFDPELNESIECTARADGNTLPIDATGTGVLQAIQILSYASVYHPRLLILDEPDSHLHPNNQRKLASLLRSLVGEHLSAIVSTHSLHLVDSLIDCSTTYWVRDGEIVPDVDNYQLKALIDIGALNEGARLREAKFVVLAEDEKRDLLSLVLEASGFNLDETEIWSYKGCSNIHTALTLVQYIRKHNPRCRIVVHRDRDCMTDEEVADYRGRFTAQDVTCFIPEVSDLEWIFCSPQHISWLYPEVTEADAVSMQNEIIANKRDEIMKKLVNSRFDFLKKANSSMNVGEISVFCEHLLEAEPDKHASGKLVLAGLHEALQRRLGHGCNLKKESKLLEQSQLRALHGSPRTGVEADPE